MIIETVEYREWHIVEISQTLIFLHHPFGYPNKTLISSKEQSPIRIAKTRESETGYRFFPPSTTAIFKNDCIHGTCKKENRSDKYKVH